MALDYHIYPYTNFHALNADWLLAEMVALRKYVESINLPDITKEQVDEIFLQLNEHGEKLALIPTPTPADVKKFVRVSSTGRYYLELLTDVANEGA